MEEEGGRREGRSPHLPARVEAEADGQVGGVALEVDEEHEACVADVRDVEGDAGDRLLLVLARADADDAVVDVELGVGHLIYAWGGSPVGAHRVLNI